MALDQATITPRREKAHSLSLVVPVFNEQESLTVFLKSVEPILESCGPQWEILFIDDGSQDATYSSLCQERAREQRIKILQLSRNFGKEIALTAGLERASGQVVIPIDVDLQDPPELIPQMLEKWREGYDIVYGKRITRANDDLLKRSSAQTFHRLFALLTDTQIPFNAGDFRLMDRKVINSIRLMPERNRFMKGLFSWVGFSQIAIEYDRPARARGDSKWNLGNLWELALNGITSFSTLPLRIWTYIGASISLLSFIYALFLILRTLIFGIDVPGYASIMVVVLVLGGLQLMSLGILGEYLGRTYLEVKQRPLYFVKAQHGLSETIPHE